MKMHIQGEDFILSEQRALLWPRQKLLAIADLHLGKALSFSTHGYWLPEQAELNDLDRMDGLIASHGIQTVLFLGDLSHSSTPIATTVRERFFALSQKYSSTQFILILGNHDQSLKKNWPSEWDFIQRIDKLAMDRIGFSHDSERDAITEDAHSTWYGHIHPVVKLAKGPERLRLPAFWLQNYRGCLPAFSSLAGGYDVPRTKKNRIYAVTESSVMSV